MAWQWRLIADITGPAGNAIQQVVLDGLEAAKWKRGTLGSGANLDTLFTTGMFYTNTGSIASSIVGRPAGFTSAFELTVTVLSTSTNIYRQTAVMKKVAADQPQRMARFSLNGVWGEWVPDGAPAPLVSGTDVDTLVWPGEYTADTGTLAASLLNRPSGFNNQTTYRVTRMGTTILQEAVGWHPEGVIHAERRTAGGVFGPWASPTSGGSGSATNTLLTVYGDSQSAAEAGATWAEQIGALLNQSTVNNMARSGDNTNVVMIRAGVKEVRFTVAGGSIPASGSVSLSTGARLFLRDDRAVASGSIAGVAGTLTHTTGNAYTFTRATAGTATPATGAQLFTSSTSTTASNVIFWCGGNDFNEGVKGQSRTIADHVLGNYRAAIEWGQRNGRRVIVAGVTNRMTALTGSEGFAQVQYVNRTLRTLYPNDFLDVQAYLVERAIYDAGLTPTGADTTAMGKGEIPPQLFVDGIHLIPAAHTAIATKWIAPWLAGSAAAFTTATLSALPDLTPADRTPA